MESNESAIDALTNFSVWMQQYYQLPPAAKAFARATFNRDASSDDKTGDKSSNLTMLPDSLFVQALADMQNTTSPPEKINNRQQRSSTRTTAKNKAIGDETSNEAAISTLTSIAMAQSSSSASSPPSPPKRQQLSVVDNGAKKVKKDDEVLKPASVVRGAGKKPDANVAAFLELKYEMSPNPSKEQVAEMSRYVGLDFDKVKNWFEQRRQEAMKAAVSVATPPTPNTSINDDKAKEQPSPPQASEKTKKPPRKSFVDFTPEESDRLEKEFDRCNNPSNAEKKRIAHELNTQQRRVEIWFTNRQTMAKFAVFSKTLPTSPSEPMSDGKKKAVRRKC